MPETRTDATQLYELVNAFEEAWQAGQPLAIDDHVPADGPLRRSVLIKLIHIDFEYRLKAGEKARVEIYLDRYPEIADDSAVVVELAEWEFSLRWRSDVGDMRGGKGMYAGFNSATAMKPWRRRRRGPWPKRAWRGFNSATAMKPWRRYPRRPGMKADDEASIRPRQ